MSENNLSHREKARGAAGGETIERVRGRGVETVGGGGGAGRERVEPGRTLTLADAAVIVYHILEYYLYIIMYVVSYLKQRRLLPSAE